MTTSTPERPDDKDAPEPEDVAKPATDDKAWPPKGLESKVVPGGARP